MPVVAINLPPQLYRKLAARAGDRGLGVDELVREAVEDAARAAEADCRWVEDSAGYPAGQR